MTQFVVLQNVNKIALAFTSKEIGKFCFVEIEKTLIRLPIVNGRERMLFLINY